MTIAPSFPTLLSVIINYVRRIIKSPSNQVITDSFIQDYINRFFTLDFDARIQVFDFKTNYYLNLQANVDKYNMPVDADGNLSYQMFLPPCYIDGIEVPMTTLTDVYYRAYPRFLTNEFDSTGNGTQGPYNFTTSQNPIARAHYDLNNQLDAGIYITAYNANGNIQTVTDGGNNATIVNNVGTLTGDGGGTVNYLTGAVSVTFNAAVPDQTQIEVDYFPFTPGAPRIILFYDNVLTFRPIPDRSYVFQTCAYLTPITFLNTSSALQYQYMAEYIARGAAQKILSDLGDYEQFNFYQPLFKEQEMLVLRRSTRQKSIDRTPTIFTERVNTGSDTFARGF